MFSAPSLGPSSLPTPPRGRRKAIPMSEVADVIVKSSKTPISTAEADTSLRMLADLCPFFLTIKTVARKEWLEMPAEVIKAASPGTAVSSHRLMTALSPSPSPAGQRLNSALGMPDGAMNPTTPGTSKGSLLEPPSSPTPGAPRLSSTHGATLSPAAEFTPQTQCSPVRTPSRTPVLSGPASPGRVRRAGGLREVRERIRRELESDAML